MKKFLKILFTIVIILSLVKMCDVEAATISEIDKTIIYNWQYTHLAECYDTAVGNRCSTNASGVKFISSEIYTTFKKGASYNITFEVSYTTTNSTTANNDKNRFQFYFINSSGSSLGDVSCQSGEITNKTTTTNNQYWIYHEVNCYLNVSNSNTSGFGFTQTMSDITGTSMILDTEIEVDVVSDNSDIIANQDKNQQQTNERLDKIDNTLKDDSTDNDKVEDTFSLIEERMAKNGTITNLVILPVTLFSKIANSVNGSCQDFSLGELFGNEISFPCIDISDYLGQAVWSTIDILFTGFFIFVIAKKMVKVFDTFTSLQEGDILD